RGPALVPGKADASELYRRIVLPKGHAEIMPACGEPLTRAQADLIRDWINQGAPWPDNLQVARHWAYVKPVRPTPPAVRNATWPRNAIDHFILARLEKEELAPSPEASPEQLIRRVYLDLIGLPPTPEEVDAFVGQVSNLSYEQLVDRLLASPAY